MYFSEWHETYGPMKVACESLVRRAFGEACTFLRPQIVAGPSDYTGRYAYWVDRAARGGTVLAAGEDTDHVQVIDARDLGRFAVTVLENRVYGTFNVAGPRLTWQAFLDTLNVREVAWVTPAELAAVEAEARELPLCLPSGGEQGGLMDIDASRALEAGLTLTHPAITARDTRDWLQETSLARALSAEREAGILRALGERR